MDQKNVSRKCAGCNLICFQRLTIQKVQQVDLFDYILTSSTAWFEF